MRLLLALVLASANASAWVAIAPLKLHDVDAAKEEAISVAIAFEAGRSETDTRWAAAEYRYRPCLEASRKQAKKPADEKPAKPVEECIVDLVKEDNDVSHLASFDVTRTPDGVKIVAQIRDRVSGLKLASHEATCAAATLGACTAMIARKLFGPTYKLKWDLSSFACREKVDTALAATLETVACDELGKAHAISCPQEMTAALADPTRPLRRDETRNESSSSFDAFADSTLVLSSFFWGPGRDRPTLSGVVYRVAGNQVPQVMVGAFAYGSSPFAWEIVTVKKFDDLDVGVREAVRKVVARVDQAAE